jgi:hypothetical protein
MGGTARVMGGLTPSKKQPPPLAFQEELSVLK